MTEEKDAASGTPRRSIARATLIVLPAQIVFRGIEAILPLLLVYWFGATRATDVYNFVYVVFSFAWSLVFTAFQDSALVPILAEERIANREGLPRLLGSLLAHTWVLGGVVALGVGALAFGTFAFKFSGPDLEVALRMVVPFTIFLVVTATRTFFGALLAAEHRFLVPPVASSIGMLANLGVLASFHHSMGIALVPVAALVGEIVATATLAFHATRLVGIQVKLCFDRPPALVKFSKLVAAEVGGSTVTKINPVVDQFMAGFVAVAGGVTILRYSGDVATLPTSILQATLLPVLLSHLSDHFARREIETVRHLVVRALAWVVGILVAVTVLLCLVRAPLLRFVFLRGAMTEDGIARMIHLFPYHLVGLAPFGALLVLARAHVALKNSSIMLSMGILNAGANLAFNLVLMPLLGLEGIALSTSSVQAAVAIVFWFRLERRLGELRREAAT